MNTHRLKKSKMRLISTTVSLIILFLCYGFELQAATKPQFNQFPKTTKTFKNKKIDLRVKVVNAKKAMIEVKNIGFSYDKTLGADLYVVCSIKQSGRGNVPCYSSHEKIHFVKGYYHAADNTLRIAVGALRPGEARIYNLLDFRGRHKPSPGLYRMKITVDPLNKVKESNERNNSIRMTTDVKIELGQHPISTTISNNKIKLDLQFQPNPLNGTIQIKNTGPGNANRTVLTFSCRKNGFHGKSPLKGCPKSLKKALSYNPSRNIYSIKVPPIRSGQTITIHFPGQHTPGAHYKKGLYYFSFDLDATHLVNESNERNNHRNVDLTVH